MRYSAEINESDDKASNINRSHKTNDYQNKTGTPEQGITEHRDEILITRYKQKLQTLTLSLIKPV